MQKLLERYRAEPTVANAQKVRVYDRKHPMAACLLSVEDTITLSQAMKHLGEYA